MKYKKIISDIEKQLKEFIGKRKAVVGISGGIDSAVVTSLSIRAIGNQNVWGISMPYGNQETRDGRLIIERLGINGREVNIKEEIDGNIKKLEKMFNRKIDRLTKGNLMARERMKILYCVANCVGGLVIGTSNKSEISIGYFTKYGDGGVDLEPIGDLYKTEVFEIAKVLGVPKEIINKKPSAGFWEGQTDEDEFGMTYQELDSVLKGELNDGKIYKKVQRLIKNSEHKRNMPNIFLVKEGK